MSATVVDLFTRQIRERPSNVAHLPPRDSAGIEVCAYQMAAIHQDVSITSLIAALNRGGLTVSNVPDLGLVIHQIGQNPERSDASL